MKNGKVRFEEGRGWFQDATSHDEIHERFRYPVLIIKKIVQEAISLPSNLCLDAPLVAVGWAALINVEMMGRYPSLYNMGALFAAVWGIYLFDRIYDCFRLPAMALCPPRHVFARSHRPLLFVLAAIATGLGLIIFPRLDVFLIEQAAIPAGLCLLYFVIFRFIKRGSRRLGFPAKELLIGYCFASGVDLTVYPQPIPHTGLAKGALAAIVAANCLIIGRAEREFDAQADPASFFGKSERGGWIPTALLSVSVFLVFVLLIIESRFNGVIIAVPVCALLQFICGKYLGKELMQPLADGALLFPWLLLLLIG